MSVRYDHDRAGFVIDSDVCPDCEQPLYDSGCDAPGCNGRACQDCGTGCDLDFVDDGDCATAKAAEDPEDYEERVNAERAAFGLSPVAADTSTTNGEQP